MAINRRKKEISKANKAAKLHIVVADETDYGSKEEMEAAIEHRQEQKRKLNYLIAKDSVDNFKMIKKEHKAEDFKLTEDDVVIHVVKHNGEKWFMCRVDAKYMFRGVNNLLHKNIYALCNIIKEATNNAHLRHLIPDGELNGLFIKAMALSNKSDIMHLKESANEDSAFSIEDFEKWKEEIDEMEILSSTFLKKDKSTVTTTQLGIGV